MTKPLLTVLALLSTALSNVALAQPPPPPPPTIEYYHLDAVGSVRAVSNENGQVVRQHHYFPFGEEYLAQGGNDRLRFTGKERDAETGLDYFGARHYGSRIGRFSTVDPVFVDAAYLDPQQWNRYSYARSNPLRFIDPTGAAIELIGSATDRERALALLRDAVGTDAGQRLYIDEVRTSDGTRFFLGIRGDLGDFMRLNEAAHHLANLVHHKSVVEFKLTTDNLSRFGGAVTFEPGESNNSSTRVLVNAAQVGLALSPSTIIGQSRFGGQTETPRWLIQPLTPEVAAWHEFGHACGYINGRSMKVNNPEALQWENVMRSMQFGTLGPRNAPRVRH